MPQPDDEFGTPLSGFPSLRTYEEEPVRPSAVDVATGAPVAVEEWLESLKISKGAKFVFWVQRRTPTGGCHDLPALKNQTLSNDEIGRRYGPGEYRPICEWRRPEWATGKTKQEEGPWFVVPPEYALPHQEWLLEQEQIFAQKKAGLDGAPGIPGVHVHNASTPTKEVMDMAGQLFAMARGGNTPSNLPGLIAVLAPLGLEWLKSQQERDRIAREEAREDRRMLLQVVLTQRGLDPSKEVPADPLSALSNPQNGFMGQVRQLGNTFRELQSAFGGGQEVAPVEAPSTLDKAMKFLGTMVENIGPFLLKNAAHVPQMMVQQAVQAQPPAAQASIAMLRDEAALQTMMEANLAKEYGPEEARKLMAAARGLKVELDPATVAEGMAELRGDLKPPEGPSTPSNPPVVPDDPAYDEAA